jgi:hypothetical protein
MAKNEEHMEVKSVPMDVQNILNRHREVLIIVADPDESAEGESTMAVFSKLLDERSVLASELSNLLRNLLESTNGKCSSVKGEAATGA